VCSNLAETDKNLRRFSKILNVYNEINLDKMAKLIGFRNSIDLEQWILDLPEKYHSYLTIRGKNVIIQSNVTEMIDDLLSEFEKWDTKKSEKIIESIDLRKPIFNTPSKTEPLILGDSSLGSAGKKFLSLLSTHKSITRNRFIKVFELETLVDIDEWLLNLPKELGVFLNVKSDDIKFEQKASDKVKLKLAEHFDNWITDVMSKLTIIDESAVGIEIRRIPSILGEGYSDFFKMNIKKEKRKFLVLRLTGGNQFTTKSDYGNKTYTTFTVNKNVQEFVSDFQPDIIEKAKKSVIEHEVNQRNGERYHYLSPARRNISRLIRTTEKDFQIRLENLLIKVVPVENFSYSILAPLQKQNILYVSSPSKMCVKCGKIFTPVSWSKWEIKYLSTNKVYVCEDCNPTLKKIIQEEKAIISLYHENKNKIESKKSKVQLFSKLNIIVFLVLALLWAVGLPSLSFFFLIIIIGIIEAYLLIKWRLFSNQIKNMKTEESLRKIAIFNSVKQYDGNLLKKRFIPEICQRCHWFKNNDQKCHVDEEVGEIYDEFNLNGEKECFKPR
jgi:hypothetical protein